MADFKLSAKDLPSREAAHNRLDAWLTKQAYAQAKNRTGDAAKVLQISRIWMNKLKKRFPVEREA